MRFEQTRRCRICKCSEDDRCFELAPLYRGARPTLRRKCDWVAPDLCSFCAEDGGPKSVQQATGPEHFSGLLDRFGQPLRWSKDLPR